MKGSRIPATQANWPDAWLIQVLLDAAVIRADDLNSILDAHERTAWLACVKSRAASDESVLAAVAKRYAMPIADVFTLDAEARSHAGFAFEHAAVRRRCVTP